MRNNSYANADHDRIAQSMYENSTCVECHGPDGNLEGGLCPECWRAARRDAEFFARLAAEADQADGEPEQANEANEADEQIANILADL